MRIDFELWHLVSTLMEFHSLYLLIRIIFNDFTLILKGYFFDFKIPRSIPDLPGKDIFLYYWFRMSIRWRGVFPKSNFFNLRFYITFERFFNSLLNKILSIFGFDPSKKSKLQICNSVYLICPKLKWIFIYPTSVSCSPAIIYTIIYFDFEIDFAVAARLLIQNLFSGLTKLNSVEISNWR